MRKIVIILTILTAALLSSYGTLNLRANKIRKVIIDAGHGGKDPGCLGKHTQEKNIAFDIAYELGNLIKMHQKDVQVVYTRHDRNEFVELRERARIANREGADLFISIHCNASTKSSIYGTETYIMGIEGAANNAVVRRENAAIMYEDDHEHNYKGFDPNSSMSFILFANYQQAFQRNSLHFATNIENEFTTTLGRHSRGVKQNQFFVLAKTIMPSVLVEVGFLTNEEDEGYLDSDMGKSYVAASVYRAFRDYKNTVEQNGR